MSIVVIVGVAALMVIGMIGAFMFILIQLVLLVDFAHAWNERWLGNYEESQSRVWFTGILLYAFVLLLLLKTNYIVIMIRALDLCSSGIGDPYWIWSGLHYSVLGFSSFCIAAPMGWISLPSPIYSFQTLDSFQEHFKTYLFLSAFNNPCCYPRSSKLFTLKQLWHFMSVLLMQYTALTQRRVIWH